MGTFMKNIICYFIIFMACLLSPQIRAQGTITYLSNLGQPSMSGNGLGGVGSDSWLAAGFLSGNNIGGYMLNSIQLSLADASGNPTAFTAMLYGKDNNFTAIHPGSSLGSLDGSTNPTTDGIYTYTPDSSMFLSPNTIYFIVLTDGTSIANGAYEWNYIPGSPTFNLIDHWAGTGFYQSNTDSVGSWTTLSANAQFAVNAMAIPEPSSFALVFLGSGVLYYVRRAFNR
jgi:hypothetical protein